VREKLLVQLQISFSSSTFSEKVSEAALAETLRAHLSPVERICGAKLAKRSTSCREIAAVPGATVVSASPNGKLQSPAAGVCGGKHGGESAIQPLKSGYGNRGAFSRFGGAGVGSRKERQECQLLINW
jgi:hypothetical protein